MRIRRFGCGDGGSNIPAANGFAVSANGRYVTKNGVPYLINECTGWGLIQSLSLANAQDFLDRRAAQGFNAVKISLISNDANMPGSPPNWAGVAPFTSAGNFSTPNPTYFAHADDVINYAISKGFLVVLVICYLGYDGVGGNQGWADEMNADTDAHLTSFGTYAATRYASTPNLMILFGGDQVPGTGVGTSCTLSRFTSLVDAYLAVDTTHLITSHLAGDYQTGGGANDPVPGGMFTGDFSTLMSRIPAGRLVDGHYGYNPSVQTYTRFRTEYAASPARPLWPSDCSAESATQPQGTALAVRDKSHKLMCEGACGNAYTHGEAWWYFSDWVSGSQGQNEVGYWYNFWSSVPWYAMVPDSTDQYVTAGRGTYGNADYVCARASASNLVAYYPSGAGKTITINMAKFSGVGATVPVRKIDPTSGTATAVSGSPFATSGSQNFSQASLGTNSAGDTDWLLAVG